MSRAHPPATRPEPARKPTPVQGALLPSERATRALGRCLAEHLRAGDVLLLKGPVGAGKSLLARAIIATLLAREGLAEDIPSPSYTLVQSYHAGALEIWHADLYRLGDPSEVVELGLDAAFDSALCLIEWPEALGPMTPPGALTLELAIAEDPDARHLAVTPGPATRPALLGALSACLAAAGGQDG